MGGFKDFLFAWGDLLCFCQKKDLKIKYGFEGSNFVDLACFSQTTN